MMGKSNTRIVRRWQDVPKFRSEAEEVEFWDSHTPVAELFTGRGPRPGSLAEKLSQQRFRPHAVYSRDDDALYLYLAWGRRGKSTDIDATRRVDYGIDGAVTGVQFLNASKGLDLSDVPERERVEAMVKVLDLPLSPPASSTA